MENYKVEFPDYDDNLSPYFAELQVIEWFGPGICYDRWIDCSWHNDTCPKICMTLKSNKEFTIWFDYKNPNKSEHREERLRKTMRRFFLMSPDQTILCETDDWNKMFQFATDLLERSNPHE